MRELFVTLGHNSSAVLAESGVVVRGYEQERLDRKKSSSAFPRDAIERALGMSDGERFCDRVYVSHWFDQMELETNKYLDLPYLASLSSAPITSLSQDFTHHDAHASSALSFLHSRRERKKAYVVVLDGFGSFQECLSVYDFVPKLADPVRIARSYGYRNSLGLMYQYATEYLGMKPHQDEYKLLGYEAHITEHVSRALAITNLNIIRRQGVDHAHRMLSSGSRPRLSGELIDFGDLKVAKAAWWEHVDMWRRLWSSDVIVDGENMMRSIIGFSAQTFLESCVIELINLLCPERDRDLVLAGGCFLNVKLSRAIRQSWKRGNVFTHPLCGDQGAAMGHRPDLIPDGLTWGDRTIGRLESLPSGCVYVDADRWVMHAVRQLEEDLPVNVVRGSAEYGPRALCNTTTFAPSDLESVTLINRLNDRDEAMPMAPVMTRSAAQGYLDRDELSRSEVSNRYMVTTIGFKDRPADGMLGVAHNDPIAESWTARPQIVSDDDPVSELLGYVTNGCLINTSFNFHGEPIVQSEADAVKNHLLQSERAAAAGLPAPLTLLVRT